MKHIIVLFFAIGSCFQANSQTTAKSILAEFGYTNISKDSIVLYSMFGHTRYRVYEDDQYIRQYTELVS